MTTAVGEPGPRICGFQLTCRAQRARTNVTPSQQKTIRRRTSARTRLGVFTDVDLRRSLFSAELPGFSVDSAKLRVARNVGDLAESLTWQTR